MQTETVLIANTNSKHKSLIALINARIKGYLSANAFQMIQYNVKRVDLAKAVTVTPGKRSPCVIPLGESRHHTRWIVFMHTTHDGLYSCFLDKPCRHIAEDVEWVAVSALVLKKETPVIMDKLQLMGATDILLFDLANCRD
jgi:ATP phosphoribosyltransferase